MTRLSYVVAADEPGVISELVQALARQTVAEDLELVVSTGSPGDWPAGEALPIRAVRSSATNLGAARIHAVRAARGEFVALGETHVVPNPGWARAVLAAHDAGATVVLPCMENANGSTALSWASFLMDYGRYTGDVTPTAAVPTHNATISRTVLLDLREPERALARGVDLDAALRADGVTVAHAPDAILAHVNVDRPVHWARERVLGGILLAQSRVRSFGRGRRLLYALAAPLIAVVLFTRALGRPRADAPRGTVPALALASVLWAAGEAIGYVAPLGHSAERRMSEYEVHKRSYVRGST